MHFGFLSLILAALVFVFFAPYRSVGFEILNGDFGIYPVTADWIRQGNWTPFQVNYDYGGSFLSVVRALWVEILVRLGETSLSAHSSYTHGVIPFLQAISAAKLADLLLGRSAAVWVGILGALGFHSWVTLGGVEFYHAYVLFGFWLLSLRVKIDPWDSSTSLVRIFVLALVSGFAIYTCRAAMVYVVAVWAPWRFLFSEARVFVDHARQIFTKRSDGSGSSHRVDRFLIGAGIFFLAFWFYLEWMGPELGVIAGKKLKVHASPNHQIAAVLFTIAWWRLRGRDLPPIKRKIQTALVAAVGAFIGFLPELLHWISLGKEIPLTGGRTTSIPDFLAILGKVPLSIRELFAGGLTVAAQFSTLLALFSIWTLFRVRDRRFDSLWAAAVLSVVAYARVYTYDFGPARYLFPLFPALMVGFGVLALRPKTRVLTILFGVAMIAHGADQWLSRQQYTERLKQGTLRSEMEQIVKTFRNEGVAFVATDSHWSGNQFTTASEWNPFFVPNESSWVLPKARIEASASPRIGLLWYEHAPKQNFPNVRVLHGDWVVEKELGKVGPHQLFVIVSQANAAQVK